MWDNSNQWAKFENEGLKKTYSKKMGKQLARETKMLKSNSKNDLRNGKYFINTIPRKRK